MDVDAIQTRAKTPKLLAESLKACLPITAGGRDGGREGEKLNQIKSDIVSVLICLFTARSLSEGSVC